MMKLLQNRKGTAEVIGTIMFIVIMLFFFTLSSVLPLGCPQDYGQDDISSLIHGMPSLWLSLSVVLEIAHPLCQVP